VYIAASSSSSECVVVYGLVGVALPSYFSGEQPVAGMKQ